MLNPRATRCRSRRSSRRHDQADRSPNHATCGHEAHADLAAFLGRERECLLIFGRECGYQIWMLDHECACLCFVTQQTRGNETVGGCQRLRVSSLFRELVCDRLVAGAHGQNVSRASIAAGQINRGTVVDKHARNIDALAVRRNAMPWHFAAYW